MMFKCPKCDTDPFERLRGLKRHMSMAHGGYTDEEITAVCQEAGSEEGAAVMGAPNFDVAAAQELPTDQPPPEGQDGTGRTPRGRGRARKPTPEEIAAEAVSKFNRKAFCDSLARDPYSAIAWYLDDKRLELTDDEAEPLVASYEQLCEMLGIQFASHYWILLTIVRANWRILKSRLPLIQERLKERGENTTQEVTPENVQPN